MRLGPANARGQMEGIPIRIQTGLSRDMDRSACVGAAIEVKRLAFYWNNMPELFLGVHEELFGENT